VNDNLSAPIDDDDCNYMPTTTMTDDDG